MIDPARLLEGHAAACRHVVTAIRAGRRPHAWLLSGEAGIGKRAFAEWVARAVFCDAAPAACGTCPGCRKVLGGNHADLEIVTRLDDAQEITVAQVREQVVPALALTAVEGRGRIVLIDGADTLNVQAQNALLKTLEEPPRGSLLLLVAERVDALLDTVRSRCQEVRLGALDEAAMASLGTGAGPLVLALARGRPGRLEVLVALDVDAIVRATDDALLGRLAGTAFGRALGALCQEAAGSVAPAAQVHEVALQVVHQRLRDRFAALPAASGEDESAPAVEILRRAERAVLEAGEDLRRHVPPAILWDALGLALAG